MQAIIVSSGNDGAREFLKIRSEKISCGFEYQFVSKVLRCPRATRWGHPSSLNLSGRKSRGYLANGFRSYLARGNFFDGGESRVLRRRTERRHQQENCGSLWHMTLQ